MTVVSCVYYIKKVNNISFLVPEHLFRFIYPLIEKSLKHHKNIPSTKSNLFFYSKLTEKQRMLIVLHFCEILL